MQQLHAIWNILLSKHKGFSHEVAMKDVALHMCSSNLTTAFFPPGHKKRGIRILKSLEILVIMDLEDTSICAPNILDYYENHPDNLDDFAANHFYEKADMNYELDGLQSK